MIGVAYKVFFSACLISVLISDLFVLENRINLRAFIENAICSFALFFGSDFIDLMDGGMLFSYLCKVCQC